MNNSRLYNEMSNKLEIDYNNKICSRAKLDTGTECNYKCFFCYYKDKLDQQTNFDVIKKRIDYLYQCDISELDLSGGESSIHPDWFKILEYCKKLGLRTSTLSNGSMFSDFEFTRKSKESGLTEILFSLHGFDEKSHDTIVGIKGAFDKIITAINNAKKLDIIVRINCTITRVNYKHLSMFSILMLKIKPLEVNFLTLNHWDKAENLKFFSYDISTKFIKESIDIIKNDIKYINVRYTPYCFMKGYEKYVCNSYQHIYDLYDWNIAVYNSNLSAEEYKNDKLKALYKQAEFNRNRSYKKQRNCLSCKYYYICDGIEKKAPDIELTPISGDKILNVNEFRNEYYE